MVLAQWIICSPGQEQGLSAFIRGFPSWGLILLLALAIYALTKSAEKMVDGSVQLARRTGMPQVLIGATVVALGTSLPETFVSVTAAWMGNPGLSLGNGVGSVICDTGLIFGFTCILAPIKSNRFVLNRTGWVQVASATLLVLICLVLYALQGGPPSLPRWVGFLFLALLAGYLYLSYLWSRESGMDEGLQDDASPLSIPMACLFVAGGLVGIILSSRLLIPSAEVLAGRMGVPDDVIAATLVALGTSLPELATALVCIRMGHPSIMLGTVVGSDVLNILFVIGASAVARPLDVPLNFFYFHFPAMLIILYTFRIFIYLNRGRNFPRWQGGVILSFYAMYLVLQYAFNLSL